MICAEGLHFSAFAFYYDDVTDSCSGGPLSPLQIGKSDGDGIFSEHLIYVTSALLGPLAVFFSSLVHHSYLPQCLCDCVLVPVSGMLLTIIQLSWLLA